MLQHQWRDFGHMCWRDAVTALPGQSACSAQHDQVGTQSVHLGGNALQGHGLVDGIAPCQFRGIAATAAGLRQPLANLLLPGCMRSGEALGSWSKRSLALTMLLRSCGSWALSNCTQRPRRSSNCGRSMPSSGFMVPISTKRAAWLCEMPSRSMRLMPEAATSSSTSTMASGSRLISST
jgi:hypothetical protein